MDIKNINLQNPSLTVEKFNSGATIEKGKDFGAFLSDAIENVNEKQIISDTYKDLLATGDVDNLHDVTIAQEKANVSLQLTMSIRNKIVEAYKEIMRMQI